MKILVLDILFSIILVQILLLLLFVIGKLSITLVDSFRT